MAATSIQNTYRRNINPFVAGQIANARQAQCESGRLVVTATGNTTRHTIAFGRAVGWIDDPVDDGGRYNLDAHACANYFTMTGSGATASVTNFAGVAVKNVALPGAGLELDNPITGATNPSPLRVIDAYNKDDLVTIGGEGDFVVVCDKVVARGSSVTLNLSTASGTSANYGMFSDATAGETGSGNNAAIHAILPGAVWMTDGQSVTPYSGGAAQTLAVLRVRQQPR